jgi:hypothetical protein
MTTPKSEVNITVQYVVTKVLIRIKDNLKIVN